MSDDDCPFCARLASPQTLPPEELVWEFRHGVALLGRWQFYEGYCLLVSRRHARELSDLGDDERRGFLDEMCLLARAVERAFRPHKLNYELLGNQVPHLHWHLFPRYADDPDALRPVWFALERAEKDPAECHRLEQGPDRRGAVAERLRNALRALTSPNPS